MSRKNQKIIICYHAIHEGDAIGNDILQQYLCLKNRADVYLYTLDLYLEETSPKSIQTLSKKKFLKETKSKHTILLLHYAGGWDEVNDIVNESKCKIYLKYHNVTPANFFTSYNSSLEKDAIKARKVLKKLIDSKKIKRYLPDSKYNGEELINFGVLNNKIKVVPPFFNGNAFQKQKININVLNEEITNNVNVLFVGRFVPNKGHKHLLNIIYRYISTYDDNIQLTLIGRIPDGMESYYEEVLTTIDDLGLTPNVKIRLGVCFEDLFSYYSTSHVFLVCSEHEGFCVPIIEAQKLKVPVVAYDSSAIKDTIGDNQIVLSEMDYYQFVCAIYTLKQNLDYRIFLAEKGLENVKRFSKKVTESALLDALKIA